MNEEQILQLVSLLPRDNYSTSQCLAESCEVSSRTIRKRIKELSNIINQNGGEIEAKAGSGYKIRVFDDKLFSRFIKNMKSKRSLFPNSKEERIQYILDYLLLSENEYTKIEYLAQQLFVSRTIVTEDLKVVRKKLLKYNVQVENKPKYGMRLIGTEFNMRLCIANNVNSNLIQDEEFMETQQRDLKKISEILVKTLEENMFQLSGMAYQNLVTHIYLMIKRSGYKEAAIIISEKRMEEIQNLYRTEIKIAKKLLINLESLFKTNINPIEVYYIAIHLAGKRVIEEEQLLEGNLVISDEINEMVKAMLDTVNEYFRIDLKNDLELRMSLALHLIPLKTRLDYNLAVKNPMLKQIKTRFTLAYTIAVQACTIFESKFCISIEDEEVGFFALHFNLALERKKSNNNQKNILIVCSSGKGTAKLLAYRCQAEFGKYVNKIETCDLYQLEHIDFKQFDYLFTTVPIKRQVPIPILEIKYFLEGEDLDDAKKIFKQDELDFVLKYFDERLFLTNVEVTSKDEVLDYIVKKIGETKNIPANFLESVKNRESQAVTEFGNLVALPHPDTPMTDTTFVTICILNKPILWGERKVQFICLMSIEKNVDKDLQLFYKIISRFLISTKDIQSVIKKRDYFHFINTLKKVEGNLTES